MRKVYPGRGMCSRKLTPLKTALAIEIPWQAAGINAVDGDA